MELIEDIDSLKTPPVHRVITIGNFDGVHKGHQALFHQVIELAKLNNATAMAITFDPHPLKTLGNNGPPLITRKDQKTELIAATGMDTLIYIPFTRAFAAISAHDFVKDILLDRLGMKIIVVGPDYTFGKDREGDVFFLKKMAEKYHFEVILPDWVRGTDSNINRISSTQIRELVMEGRVDETEPFLGRHYQIRGKVVKGRERGGSQLGFPTANIKLYDELCPQMGVYAVTVETTTDTFNGVANIGYSPTFDDHIFTIEVHILDFSQDLYGSRIRVNMIKRLRDEIKFPDIDALSAQIRADIESARKILA